MADHPRPWINITEFQEFEDYEFRLTVREDLGLYVATAICDGRDSIVGWRFKSAPPAQQYGFRLQEWLWRNKRQQEIRERVAAAHDEEEPF